MSKGRNEKTNIFFSFSFVDSRLKSSHIGVTIETRKIKGDHGNEADLQREEGKDIDDGSGEIMKVSLYLLRR